MLHAIASAFIGVTTFVGSLLGIVPAPAQAPEADQTLGASLPSGTAVFETSLQSRISSTDTSMTLVANTVRGGSSLSGFDCFTIDEGRTDAEYVCGTISGTTVSGLTRGIDPSTGTTSNSVLKFAHRVGANVKKTDFPLIQILRNQAAGTDTYSNTLTYAAGVTPAATGDLTDKEYVDGLAFNGAGVINASTLAKGVVELATGAEAAASTASGSSGPLALPASLATSTYNAATAPNRVLVSQANGILDLSFLGTTTVTLPASLAITGSSTIASTTVYATTTSGTWTKPANLRYIIVEMVGGGAAGGGLNSDFDGGYSGAAGGYCRKVIPATAITSTVAITIGTGGTGVSGGGGGNGTLTSFGSYASSTGATDTTPGIGKNCDVNISGGPGSPGYTGGASPVNFGMGAPGGSSYFGSGGAAVGVNGTTIINGQSAGATNYGAGGGGAANGGSTSASTGGNGAPGYMIITSVFF